MKKTLIFTIIFLLFCIGTIYTGFAQDINFNEKTVITEDNMSEILRYYGIEENNIIQNRTENSKENRITTVGDLEKALEEIKKLPNIVNVNSSKEKEFQNNKIKSEYRNFLTSRSDGYYGTATVSQTTTHSDYYDTTYTVNGGFYSSASVSYWIQGYGAEIDVADGFGIIAEVTDVRKLISRVIDNGNILRVEADYTVEYYLGFEWGNIPYGSSDVTSNINFNTSYIPY